MARVVTLGSCLHETVSAVRCLGVAHSETHGLNPTRCSLAALPLEEESSYFRTKVSLLEAYLHGGADAGRLDVERAEEALGDVGGVAEQLRHAAAQLPHRLDDNRQMRMRGPCVSGEWYIG